MRIQQISDLHTERYDDPVDFISRCAFAKVDVLAVCGDIITFRMKPRQIRAVFDYLCHMCRNVLYVPGNHDFWGAEGWEVDAFFNSLEREYSGFRYLHNRIVEIDGWKFLGGPMFYRDEYDQGWWIRKDLKKEWPDFRYIRHCEQLAELSNGAFTKLLEQKADPKTIVMTHYAPSYRSVNPQYAQSVTNTWFVCDQSKLIAEKEPRLWMHGHIHWPSDYMLLNTQISCYPHGTPRERNSRPYPPKVITL